MHTLKLDIGRLGAPGKGTDVLGIILVDNRIRRLVHAPFFFQNGHLGIRFFRFRKAVPFIAGFLTLSAPHTQRSIHQATIIIRLFKLGYRGNCGLTTHSQRCTACPHNLKKAATTQIHKTSLVPIACDGFVIYFIFCLNICLNIRVCSSLFKYLFIFS